MLAIWNWRIYEYLPPSFPPGVTVTNLSAVPAPAPLTLSLAACKHAAPHKSSRLTAEHGALTTTVLCSTRRKNCVSSPSSMNDNLLQRDLRIYYSFFPMAMHALYLIQGREVLDPDCYVLKGILLVFPELCAILFLCVCVPASSVSWSWLPQPAGSVLF